jgi:23S rRNA A2030 N6-methylase RlmJ
MSDYSHHKKAGNRGDCFKHPGLIHAIDIALKKWRGMNGEEVTYKYLDMFAAHAWHPLFLDTALKQEWKTGVGEISTEIFKSKGALIWSEYGKKAQGSKLEFDPDYPKTVRWYPGSTVFARRVFNDLKQHKVKWDFCDINEDALNDLKGFHSKPKGPFNIGYPDYRIRTPIVDFDFIFIDPPNDKPLENLLDFVIRPRSQLFNTAAKQTMIWLPRADTKKPKNGSNLPPAKWEEPIKKLHKEGMVVYDITWLPTFSRSAGCIIALYEEEAASSDRLTQDELGKELAKAKNEDVSDFVDQNSFASIDQLPKDEESIYVTLEEIRSCFANRVSRGRFRWSVRRYS